MRLRSQHQLPVAMAGLISLCSCAPAPLVAEDSTQVYAGRIIAISAVTATSVTLVHLYQQRAWWQGPRAPFRFENDWEYALNIDKVGHTYGAYLLSNLFGGALRWSGADKPASMLYGSLFGLGFQLYVEVEDGFHKQYGFSPGDAIADVCGAMVPLAQQTFPVLRNFSMKWSYVPSREYLNALKMDRSRSFIDDYEGQIYWLGIDPHFLMGGEIARAVPAWLGLSLGVAVRNLDQLGHGDRMFYLALDYNLSRIGTESGFLRSLFEALDFIHFPSPGIVLERGRVRAGIFY